MAFGASWRLAACAVLLAAGAGGLSLAQTPEQPPVTQPQLIPPPTVLLPPTATPAPSDLTPEAASSAPPVKPPEPPKPVRHAAAIIQALDKVTAETLRFEAPVNQPIRYKDLVFTVHVCEDAAPGQRGAAAHIEIDSQPRPVQGRVTPAGRQLFKGWIFASAPGLHPFEHPVYDAWLLGCKAG